MENGLEPLSEQLLESLEKRYQIYLECPDEIDQEIDFFLLLDKVEETPQLPGHNSSYIDNNYFMNYNNLGTQNTKYSNQKFQHSPRKNDTQPHNYYYNASISDTNTNMGTINNPNSQMNNITNLSLNANTTTTNNTFNSFHTYGLGGIRNIQSSSPGYAVNKASFSDYPRQIEDRSKNGLSNTPERKTFFSRGNNHKA